MRASESGGSQRLTNERWGESTSKLNACPTATRVPGCSREFQAVPPSSGGANLLPPPGLEIETQELIAVWS